jgi:hypothetical protein
MVNTILLILIILVVILGYTTINLLFKIEKQEDIISQQNIFFEEISDIINKSEVKLNEIDAKGIFKSDDEIGWFFNEVKKIQSNISHLRIKL